MRAVVQLVSKADVSVNNRVIGRIGQGLVIFLGVSRHDTEKDIDYLANKILNLRIFPDENDKMNLSVLDVQGEILLISQFTLFGDCRKGRRPSYSNAAPPNSAKELFQLFCQRLEHLGVRAATGEFQASMNVSLVNKGPVTILLDSEKEF